jgi:hypothetical protein
MAKRQKKLGIKILKSGAIFGNEPALAVALLDFFGICRVLQSSKSDGGAFGIWDFH